MASEGLGPIRVEAVPRIVLWATVLLLIAGIGDFAAWWYSGNWTWVSSFFFYPGALFLVASSALGLRLSYLCWRRFSSGDMLRPAWLLITASAAVQLSAALVRQVLGAESFLNPLHYSPGRQVHQVISNAFQIGGELSPFYMVFLAAGLFRVLQVCKRHGVLGALKAVDMTLLAVVTVYTIHYFTDVVFSSQHPEGPASAGRIIGWTSDPLLCILLLEAILIRRSTANMGWGLISRCWLAFTAAIFFTSLGDVGLWASARGFGPYALQAASWYIWFLPSACFALAPAYQLQAMLHATQAHDWDQLPHEVPIPGASAIQ
ncbi:MAG TPA: hypothetical protein VMJ34_23525 [Bryobacteraceae bacterium]|nr:hypothetical protein [Bryobacteraceae bacterium]